MGDRGPDDVLPHRAARGPPISRCRRDPRRHADAALAPSRQRSSSSSRRCQSLDVTRVTSRPLRHPGRRPTVVACAHGSRRDGVGGCCPRRFTRGRAGLDRRHRARLRRCAGCGRRQAARPRGRRRTAGAGGPRDPLHALRPRRTPSPPAIGHSAATSWRCGWCAARCRPCVRRRRCPSATRCWIRGAERPRWPPSTSSASSGWRARAGPIRRCCSGAPSPTSWCTR